MRSNVFYKNFVFEIILTYINRNHDNQNLSPRWPLWQKIIFRILFLFLVFFTIQYGLWSIGISYGINLDLESSLTVLNHPLHWLDVHWYHFGYDPAKNGNFPPDYIFGVVLFITVFIAVIIATALWSLLDSKRPSYNQLNYWFRTYLRYAIAVIMLNYGLMKTIPNQMPAPDGISLLSRLGEQSHFSVLWNFMGASPSYEIFTGLCEVFASLLLVFRRTRILGYLIMCIILINVVALNIFYNVPVKIDSSLLLISTIYLAAPYFNKLIQLFYYGRQVGLSETQDSFEKKSLVLNIVAGLFIASLLSGYIFHFSKGYERLLVNHSKIYNVTSFTTKDTLSSNITDTLNWKRLVLTTRIRDKKPYAIIYYGNELQDWYNYTMDTTTKIFTISDISGPIINSYTFTYKITGENLHMTGKFKGQDADINMNPQSLDSMNLNKEKIKLVQDY